MQGEPSAITRAICSFPNASGGGPDCFRLQLLKDLMQATGDGYSALLQSLANFSALVMEGREPEAVRPFFSGATLVVLQKPSGEGGGVRPKQLAVLVVGWWPRGLGNGGWMRGLNCLVPG